MENQSESWSKNKDRVENDEYYLCVGVWIDYSNMLCFNSKLITQSLYERDEGRKAGKNILNGA